MYRKPPSVFLNLMFKLFFKHLDNFLVFRMDDLIISSQTEEENLKHIQLVIKKFQKAEIKLKMSKCELFKSKIEHLGHSVSVQGTFPHETEGKAIMDLVPATNITEACHMIGLISCFRKLSPVFNDMV